MGYQKKQKKSLLLYYNYIEQFEMLNDKQLRQLIYAMIEYDKTGETVELDNITKMAFVPIKRQLKQDKEMWETSCKTNSENARKRWSKKNTTVCDDMQLDTTVCDRMQSYADKDKDKDKDNDNDKDKDNNINNTIKLKQLEIDFEHVWCNYPRKQGKKNALKSYIKARKNGTTEQQIKEGLSKYLDYIKTNKIQLQFVKQGSTWFNQECWNDTYLAESSDSDDTEYIRI